MATKENDMNEELLHKLLEYIDARINEKMAADDDDGGVSECIYANRIRSELLDIAKGE